MDYKPFTSREIKFRYKLYDKDNVFKHNMYNILSASMDYNSLTRLKTSASITMEHDDRIDYLNDQIKIICVIDEEEYPLGQFLISSPDKSKNGKQVIRECECFSKLIILEQSQIENRYVVLKGTNVVAEVKRIISNKYLYDITDSALTTSVDREWEIGTPFLTIINDLLEVINYTSLRVDLNGVFTATPYILPTDRQIEITYKDDQESIIFEEIKESIDYFDAKNVFIRYVNNPDIYPPLRAVFENNNISSETSIIRRGRRLPDIQEVSDVADLQTLQDICKKDGYNATDKYKIVEFETAINPIHGYMNCINFSCYGDGGKFIETAWSIDCKTDGRMKHRIRSVVNI